MTMENHSPQHGHRPPLDQGGDPVQGALFGFLPKFPEGPVGTETVSIDKALGRVVAREIKAPIDSPPYSRSIIEGFAVNTEDIAGASEQNPVLLSLQGEITVGMSKAGAIKSKNALQVSTGSLIPPGDVAVLRFLDIDRKDHKIYAKKSLQNGENIETKGCDIQKGTGLIPKGQPLSPSDIGLLASMGILRVTVSRKPKVAIFSSGNEVISPSKKLKPGFIWDCNAYALSACVTETGGIPSFKGIMKDDFKGFLKKLKSVLPQVDMVLISGGTAIGGRDFIKDLIDAAGKPGVLVNGVPMRSGKPLIMGVVSKKPIVCVAGHPPEALRGFTLFGVPAMARLLGKKEA